MEPPPRDQVRDDLKGLFKGELLFEPFACALYSTDASLFAVEPLGAAVPRDEDDVRVLVRYARDHGVPLVARGAGTGLAGEALGRGLVVDLSRHLRELGPVGADTVRVQPGVRLGELNHRLAREGRRFAPDPAHPHCTVGGMLATNASGARAIRHGTVADHVVSVSAVLDDGERIEAGRQSRRPVADAPAERVDTLAAAAGTLLEQHAGLIRAHPPRTRFDRCGYRLHDVLSADAVDLARLLVGSEGTLALFTGATLRTVPLAGGRSVALFGFASLDGALHAVRVAAGTGPSACELLDRRLLRLARGAAGAVETLVPATAEAVLIVEYEAESPEAAHAAGAELTRALQGRAAPRLALLASGEDEAQRLWQVREAALPGLYTLRGGAQPLPFIEDVGVPPEALGEYLTRVQEILQRHELTATFLVHAAAGQVHMRPFLDPQRPGAAGEMWALAEDVYALVLSLGGTVSAQHGTGLARTPWVSRQVGALFPVYRELKALFDPKDVLNPGKVVGPTAGASVWPLRPLLRVEPPAAAVDADSEAEAETDAAAGEGPAAAAPLLPAPALRWASGAVTAEVQRCNGCGECRSEAPGQRMCPAFRATGDEAATPRAKANLLRSLLRPDADPRQLSSRAVREVADLCVNCKMCAGECPAQVNIPKLMLEAKAAHVAEQGLDRNEWVLARVESFLRLGSAVAPFANALLGNAAARWLLEKLLGLSRLRRLPRFAQRSFFRLARQRGWTRKPRGGRPRVAYFVDVYAGYCDPSIAEATVAVLHHNGVEVYVPPRQWGCGMAPLSYGDVETAREAATHNLRLFADLAREGYPIVCSEPTAALMLRRDALDLLDDPDAELVAARTVELTAFLHDLHRQGRLRTDFLPLPATLGHHVPCHLKALGGPPVGPALLSLIPEVRVRTIDVSCSGMAGTYGLRAGGRDLSLAAGKPMLDALARPDVLFGSTECSACRLQMEDAGDKRTLHPVQYLALSYGLLPELRDRLLQPLGSLLL